MNIMTPAELAKFLRVEPEEAAELLERGDIPYFMVAGEVRILEDAVWQFIREQSELRSRQTAAQVLMGNQVWRNLMAKDPALLATVRQMDSGPNSFGTFLKNAMK